MSGTKKASSKPNVLKTGRLHSPVQATQSQRSDVPEATIRKLSEILKSTDLAEIEIKTEKMTVRVRAKESAVPTIVTAHSAASPAPSVGVVSKTSQLENQPDLHIIRSPFIGTFYRAASPNSAAFVEPGQAVNKGQALCIIEAMKLMNEIECDAAGVVDKVFVENGVAVEFNTALFSIRKS